MNVSNPAEPWRDHYAHPCLWDQQFAPLSLPAMLEASARVHPDASLVEFFGRNYSYGGLYDEARRFAAGLIALGIEPGDRVGLYLPNVPTYVPAYYGAMMAGATVVNFSPLYTVRELTDQVVDSGTKLLVTVDLAKLLPGALEVLAKSPLERLVVARFCHLLPRLKGLAYRLLNRRDLTAVPRADNVHEWSAVLSSDPFTPIPIDPEHDLALLQYTGGTTGTPKGAMLTHQNLTANARQVAAVDPHAHDRDVILGVLPLFHVFANTCVLNRTVFDGGCIVMLPRFDVGQVFAAIRRTRPTAFPGVPTMYQALLDDPRLDGTDMSSLRVCISGGAPLPAAVKERFQARTGVVLVEGYGLTESSGVVSTNPYEGENRTGSIGQPVPGTRLRLLDREDPTRDAPPGEPGELAFTGPQTMQGYWHRPEAAATAFAVIDGERWLRTGDVAVMDPDGFVRIVDRLKDMIAVGGFKVFPSQVEAALLLNPAVKEALVIGVPDAYHGEVPRAYVTLNPKTGGAALPDSAALRDWLNARIGKHERVDTVVIRDALPKTMIGKLDRKALRLEALGAETLGGAAQ